MWGIVACVASLTLPTVFPAELVSSYGSSSSSGSLYKHEKYSFEDDDVDKGGTVSKGN